MVELGSSHDGGDGYPTARRREYDLLQEVLATAAQQDEGTDAPELIGANPPRLSQDQEQDSNQQVEGQHQTRRLGPTCHDHG